MHDFGESLERSNEQADAPWWSAVYQKAFDGVESMVSVRKDGWAQRGGIDRVITLQCGRVIRVDEKIRTKVFNDILLERWSDYERRTHGWVRKPLACDFIAYAFVPSATCYLLPVLTLQRAWRGYANDWIGQYGEVRAYNKDKESGRTWTTISTPVPIDVLMSAIADAMRIQWHSEAQAA